MNSKFVDGLRQQQRMALVQTGRMANTAADALFYDISCLSMQERQKLSSNAKSEGSVLVVYPAKMTKDILDLSPLEFINKEKEGRTREVDALVIAGVGCSALGTAALARDVADYIERPVAGVISGYGLADLFSESMGGWLALGYKNRIRDGVAKFFSTLSYNDNVWEKESYQELVKSTEIAGFQLDRFIYSSPDAVLLLLILYHLKENVRLLIGHSKGNYVIEKVLEGMVSLCKMKKSKPPEQLKVITLGAAIKSPKEFKSIQQFMGSVDFFGMANSRPQLTPEKVPGAWHSLNTRLPGHVDLKSVMEKAGVK